MPQQPSIPIDGANRVSAKLTQLTDGSETTLHSHPGGNEAHTVASHTDTTATGAELETLTDGSNADALHTHAGAGPHTIASHSDTTATGAELETLTDGSNADALHAHALAAHTIASHSDTTATGAELETLTDGSNADALHSHSPSAHTIASHSDTTATGAELETLTDGSNADALHTHTTSGSLPNGTAIGDNAWWNNSGAGWVAAKFYVNAAAAPYSATTDGSADTKAALTTAVGDVDNGAGGIVYCPNGRYRLDTALTIPERVWVISTEPVAAWGSSGNKTAVFTGGSAPNFTNVLFGSNQAIHMVEFENTATPTSQDWRGGGLQGIGFYDYSASHNTVLSAVRVKNLNRVNIFGCSFTNFQANRAVYMDPNAGAGEAGQYTTFYFCTWEDCYSSIEFVSDVPDIELYACLMYGKSDGSNNPLSGSIGLHLRTSSFRMYGGAIQFYDTMIKIDGTTGGAAGKANKFYGVAIEWHQSGTNGAATAGVWITNSNCKNNLISGLDFANTAKTTDTIRIDTGVANTVVAFCSTGVVGELIVTTNNGTNTKVFTFGDNDIQSSPNASFNINVWERKVINFDDGVSDATLPPAAQNEGAWVFLVSQTGGSNNITVTTGDDLNDVLNGTVTMAAYQIGVAIALPGNHWKIGWFTVPTAT